MRERGFYGSTPMKFLSLTAGFVLPAVLASAAQAQLLNHKDLSLATALAIATTASETCKAQGNRVTVAVIGRTGELIVQLRGDDASPHTIENSFRKAYTARTFRTASGAFGQRQKEKPPGFATNSRSGRPSRTRRSTATAAPSTALSAPAARGSTTTRASSRRAPSR